MKETEDYLGGFFDMALLFGINGGSPRISLFDNRKPIVDILQLLYYGRKYPHTQTNLNTTWEWRIRDRNQALFFLNQNGYTLTLKAKEVEIIRECFKQKLKNGGPENYALRLSEARQQAYALPYLPHPATLAGMLDAAGGMGIYSRSRAGNKYYEVGFSLTSPYVGMLTRLQKQYPETNLALARKSATRYNGSSVYMWWATGKDTEAVLKHIQTYILTQGPIVDLMLRMLDPKDVGLTENEIAYVQSKMRGLKRKVEL